MDYREIRVLGEKSLRHLSKESLWPTGILGSGSVDIDAGKPVSSELVQWCACSCVTCFHLGLVRLCGTVRLNQTLQHLLAQYREGISED